MLVRVIEACSQPINRTGRIYMLREGRVVEWDRDGELPEKYFQVLESAGTSPEEVEVDTSIEAAPPSLHALDRDSQIIEALNRLDHKNSEHWTTQGLPRVDVVSFILDEMGFESEVTRAELNVARPGFCRD